MAIKKSILKPDNQPIFDNKDSIINRDTPKSESDLQNENIKLKAMLDKLMSEKSNNVDAPIAVEELDEFESIKIAAEDYIKIISLTPHELNLSTGGFGRGKKFKFEKMYDIKRVLYSDLVDIMENNSKFLNEGFFLILDKRVVRKNGLDDAYSKILTKEKIEQIVNNSKDAVDLFKSANPRQREFITDMLIAKIRDNQEVDLNMIDRISRIAGFNLQERGEESKLYSQPVTQ